MFRRYRIATLLNLFGLSVAVATFYLFMTQVIYNRTYNHNINDYEHTYRLEIYGNLFGDNWGCTICRPFASMLKDVPQVKSVVYYCPYVNKTDVKVNNRTITVPVVYMSKPGIEFFTGKLISGSSKAWSTGATAIVNRSTAEKMFGTANAVGKTFEAINNNDGGTIPVTVVGVSEDMPDNCTVSNGLYICDNESGMTDWSEWSYCVFLRLAEGTNPKKVERAIKLAFMKANGISPKDEKEFDKQMKFRITSVDDVYFSGIGQQDKGNRSLVDVLTVASVFVLFIALLNLLNFQLSEVPMRMRGVNTRRVMGASVGSLRLKMIMESVLFAFVALLVGVLLVVAFQRSEACMKLVSGDIGFSAHWLLAAVMAASALVVGALAALVPAFYSTSFAPALVLKGSFGLSPRGRQLRLAIMAVQFCVAFVLAIYIGVMSSQSNYIFNSDYGFNKNEVFYAWLSNEAKAKRETIRTELKKLPFVESVGFAQSAIGTSDQYMGWGRGNDEHQMSLQVLPCDYEYTQTMGLKILEGRNFNEADMKTGAYVLNKAAMQQYKWLAVGDSIGRQNEWGFANYLIVGVCNNFKLKSMRNDNSRVAVAFIIFGPDMEQWGDRCGQVFVRVAKGQDKVEAKRRIADVLNRLDASQKYEMNFLDNDLQQTYVEEFRFISQVKFFAIICIIITVIGVFSLTMFETEYRRKEIGIRKVMGSSVGSIVRLFAMRYTVPLVVSFAVAAPVGWWLSMQWLQSFAEHTPLHWWLFPLSFVGVSAVVIATVVAQSWRVATQNPVESIKTE